MSADAPHPSFEPSRRGGPLGDPIGSPDPDEVLSISLYLRGHEPESISGPALSREQYAAAHGASDDDVDAVVRFADSHELTVASIDRGSRRVELVGALGVLAPLFGATMSMHLDEAGVAYRARSGALTLPPELAEVLVGVFGFDTRPQARHQSRPGSTAAISYSPPEVASAYGYPSLGGGAGECIGIVELGGGYRPPDLKSYFESLHIAEPKVTAVPVDGGKNTPGAANGPDGEVMLDIEVSGSIAPHAALAVYFAPNTDQGFLDAVNAAVHDTTHRPSVVSISWGGPESTWTAQAMTTMEQAFVAAAAMGVTVTVAAGDNGSSDGVTDGLAHVDFPASAPHALACGGTRLELSSGAISSETVWNDGSGDGATGGGISSFFPVPSYQASVSLPPSANPGAAPGRGVPDVSGDADPETGYLIEVDGQRTPIGGTSAVAPLWAGLIALLNEQLGRPVGFLQPFLYSGSGMASLNDITSGSNGAYSAAPGWDACTGLGSPNGAALLKALSASAAPAPTAPSPPTPSPPAPEPPTTPAPPTT